MFTLTIVVGMLAIIVFAIGYVAENSPSMESMGHPAECFMCNRGTCEGCPIDERERRLS